MFVNSTTGNRAESKGLTPNAAVNGLKPPAELSARFLNVPWLGSTLYEFEPSNLGGIVMLETIIVIVLVLWLLGLVAGQTFGGILHALLLVALVIFVIRLLTGRRAV